ncbi:hypothetical protein Droror1_Dr00007394 [Drosera rotundifolia]
MIKPHHTTTTTLILPFLFLLLSISFHLFPFPQTLTLTHPPPPPSPSRTTHIVRFVHYKHAREHLLYLRENLRNKNNRWEWIERRNPAAAYPTDFGVLEIDDEVRVEVVEELEGLELAKDVSVEFRYTRGLLGRRGDDGGDGCVFGVGRKRRPGKIFTRMSFNESEGGMCGSGGGNGSFGSRSRRLLLQVKETVYLLCGLCVVHQFISCLLLECMGFC